MAHSYKAPHSKNVWGYSYVEYCIANTYELDPMADSHSCQRSAWSEPYSTQLLYEAPHSKKLWGHLYVKYPMDSLNWTLWQIAIAVREVHGVNLTTHSYCTKHPTAKSYGVICMSSTPWIANTYELDLANSYGVICMSSTPWIANTYELDPMADSHSCQSNVWSENFRHTAMKHHSAKSYGVICMSSTP